MNILIVDDDFGVSRSLCSMIVDLLDSHYLVESANSPDEAFGMMEEKHYHIVISDLNLENINFNGIGVLLAAKKRYPNVVAILMSAEDIRTEDVRKMGIDRFLGKPVSLELLEEVLQS